MFDKTPRTSLESVICFTPCKSDFHTMLFFFFYTRLLSGSLAPVSSSHCARGEVNHGHGQQVHCSKMDFKNSCVIFTECFFFFFSELGFKFYPSMVLIFYFKIYQTHGDCLIYWNNRSSSFPCIWLKKRSS